MMFSTFLCIIRDIIATILTCPLSAGEPDTPVLSPDRMKVERNTFYIPLQHVDQGASPLQHFNLRYRKVTDAPSAWVSYPLSPTFILSYSCSQDKDSTEWKEMQLSPSADSISLQDLSFGSGYEVEVKAINFNGSSIPATFNFTIGEQPGKRPCISYCIGIYSS